MLQEALKYLQTDSLINSYTLLKISSIIHPKSYQPFFCKEKWILPIIDCLLILIPYQNYQLIHPLFFTIQTFFLASCNILLSICISDSNCKEHTSIHHTKRTTHRILGSM